MSLLELYVQLDVFEKVLGDDVLDQVDSLFDGYDSILYVLFSQLLIVVDYVLLSVLFECQQSFLGLFCQCCDVVVVLMNDGQCFFCVVYVYLQVELLV